MDDYVVTTADLLDAWREASRAAELAERLASLALDAAEQADANALASEEIANLADEALRSAEHAADIARKAATRARELASQTRLGRLAEADEAVRQAHAIDIAARDRYHSAEREVKDLPERAGRA